MGIASNIDTICAIATPQGMGGIGVVRISGPAAFSILEKLWKGRIPPASFQARKLYLGELASELGTRNSGLGNTALPSSGSRVPSLGIIDKVLAVKMPGPHTYTGQDVVEISCHGSRVVLAEIVRACTEAGSRLAGPGEFTRRAFLAGKMDLAQAEAVCDLIHATGERGARLASEQLDGKLSQEVSELLTHLSELRGEVEASIDFPEEDICVAEGSFESHTARIDSHIGRLLDTYASGRLCRDGVRVAIVGRPNAGKSSIMNRLSGMERSIVHHVPGTTRDVVEESVLLGGVLFRLRDTAGVRNACEEVEAMGVMRTQEEIEQADLVLVVLDAAALAGDAFQSSAQFAGHKRAVVAINKIDLGCAPAGAAAGALATRRVSAKTGEGMEELERALVQAALGSCAGGECVEGAVITSERHRAALSDAREYLQRSARAHAQGEPAECVAQYLRSAHESLAAITGEAATEAVLDRIFSRFCIGK